MTSMDIFRNLGGLDPALIERAAPDRDDSRAAAERKAEKSRAWVKWACAAAAVVVLAVLIPALISIWNRPAPAFPLSAMFLKVDAADVYVDCGEAELGEENGYAASPDTSQYVFTRPRAEDEKYFGFWRSVNKTYFALRLNSDGTCRIYQMSGDTSYDECWDGVYCFAESTLSVFLTGESEIGVFDFACAGDSLTIRYNRDTTEYYEMTRTDLIPTPARDGNYAFDFRQGMWTSYESDERITLEFMRDTVYVTPWDENYTERGQMTIIPYTWDEMTDTVYFEDWHEDSRGQLRAVIRDGRLFVGTADSLTDRSMVFDGFRG